MHIFSNNGDHPNFAEQFFFTPGQQSFLLQVNNLNNELYLEKNQKCRELIKTKYMRVMRYILLHVIDVNKFATRFSRSLMIGTRLKDDTRCILLRTETRQGHFFPIFIRKEIKTRKLERKSKQQISRLNDLLYRLNDLISR